MTSDRVVTIFVVPRLCHRFGTIRKAFKSSLLPFSCVAKKLLKSLKKVNGLEAVFKAQTV
jgi:hypothetical protein